MDIKIIEQVFGLVIGLWAKIKDLKSPEVVLIGISTNLSGIKTNMSLNKRLNTTNNLS